MRAVEIKILFKLLALLQIIDYIWSKKGLPYETK